MRNIEFETKEENTSKAFLITQKVKRTALLGTLPSLMMIALSACGGGGGGSGTGGDNSDTGDGDTGGNTGGNTEVNEITITDTDPKDIQLTQGNDKATGDDRNNEFKLSTEDTAGNDTLIGGDGSDTYTLAVNQTGTLRITDSAGVFDVLHIVDQSENAVDAGKVAFSLKENTLEISYDGTTRATITDWNNPDSRIERLEIGDETYNLASYTYEEKLTELGRVITGQEGDDSSLFGTQGEDLFYGSFTNDDVFGSGGNDTLYGGAGNDRLEGGEGNDRLYGGAGNDRLTGGTENDRLYGGAGDDYLNGLAGNNILYGDGGNDNLSGGVGDDTLFGGAGDDRLYGGEGDDIYIVRKGEGYDWINDLDGNDTLELHGFTEGDLENIVIKYDGTNLNFFLNDEGFLSIQPPNYDIYIGRNETNYRIETLKTIDESGNEEFYDLSGDTFEENTEARIVELTPIVNITITGDGLALQLTAVNDKATGDNRNNEFLLSQGDSAGSDTLIGGAGNDKYTLAVNQTGTLTITDSAGNLDVLRIADRSGNAVDAMKVAFNLNEEDNLEISYDGELRVTITDWNNPDSRIEGLEIGGETYNLFSYRDEENPTELGKVITEPNEDGTLIGGAGKDYLLGGAGDDTLNGGEGDDWLYGGAGDDTLNGGEGNDWLYGGAGNDVYIVRKGEGNDWIVDQGGNDTLELHGFTAAEVGNIVIKLEGTNLDFSLNDAQFLYIGRWDFTNALIETLKIIDGSGNETSYNLSEYTFEADTEVSIADLTETTPSLVDDGANFLQDDEALIGVTSLDVVDF